MKLCNFRIAAHEKNGIKIPAVFCGRPAKSVPVGIHMCKLHAKEFVKLEERQPAEAMQMIYHAIKRRK